MGERNKQYSPNYAMVMTSKGLRDKQIKNIYYCQNITVTKSTGLSCEDAQDKDDWRLRIKEATS